MDVEQIKKDVKPRVERHISKLIIVWVIYTCYIILFPINIFLFFIEPGINYFFIRFVNKKRSYPPDVFKYINKRWDFFYTGFLRRMITFGYSLLFIVPGIIKHYEYALVPQILTDPKLKDVRGKACLELSKQMMAKHMGECFLLDISFIYWHLLAIPTLGFLELYIMPYQLAARYKLLYEIKINYLGEEPSYIMESDATYTPVAIIHRKRSIPVPINQDAEGHFKPKFCMRCGERLPKESNVCLYCGFIYEHPKEKEKTY